MNNKKMSARSFRPWFLFAILGAGVGVLSVSGCGTTYENRNPVGEIFPSAVGENLDEERVELPEALAGEPAILLVGYKQRTQFDIDRWIMGLIQADAPGQLLEVPTIPGLGASIASDWIDDGIRSGNPEEDWGTVGDAPPGMGRRPSRWRS